MDCASCKLDANRYVKAAPVLSAGAKVLASTSTRSANSTGVSESGTCTHRTKRQASGDEPFGRHHMHQFASQDRDAIGAWMAEIEINLSQNILLKNRDMEQ